MMTAHPITRQAPTAVPRTAAARRGAVPRHRVCEDYSHQAVWVLVFAVCVLGIGWAGVLLPDWRAADMLRMGHESIEETPSIVELMAEDFPPSAAEAPPAPIEKSISADVMEIAPEPVPVLAADDVFAVPAPPEIIKPVSVADPPPERPRPATQPGIQPRRGAETRTPPPSSAPARGGSSGAVAGKAEKARTPQPPYPAFARSAKMTGTVVVSIIVDSSGSVVSATAARSSGHLQLDAYTCNYIRRSWRWPAGGRRTFSQAVSFRLR
jgi:TonB family protein